MLTIAQYVVIENFTKELVALIQNAIKTKPIKRVSRRFENGRYVDRTFSSPVSASGRLANEVTYEITDKGISIYANEYIYELVFGKKPALTGGELNQNLESQIKAWMQTKGIHSEKVDDNTLAYLITNKIRKFGSSIYLANHGNNSGLLENILSTQLISNYNAKFTQQLAEDFKEAFISGK